MAAYNNATREPLALHIPLKEYAANILVLLLTSLDYGSVAVIDSLRVGQTYHDQHFSVLA